MDINEMVKAFASGEMDRDALRESFQAIGFSEPITDILLTRADGKRAIYQRDEANGVDPSKFSMSVNEIWGVKRKPSGSLGEGGDGVEGA